MLPLDVELPLFIFAVLLCLVVGAVLSRPDIFKLFLRQVHGIFLHQSIYFIFIFQIYSQSSGIYLKAGEYGETELENK